MPGKIIRADFDGDGHLDLLGNAEAILFGGDYQTFGTPVSISDKQVRHFAVSSTAARPDILALYYSGEILHIMIGADRRITRTVLPLRATNENGNSLMAGDFNADGRSDFMVILNDRSTLLIRNETGGFDEQPATLSDSLSSVKPGDFNGDGLTDLAGYPATSGSLVLLTNRGGGSFTFAGSIPATVWTFAIADVSNDGRDDIVAAIWDYSRYDPIYAASTFATFVSSSTGLPQLRQSWPSNGTPIDILLADFNGDGFRDIVRSTRGWLAAVGDDQFNRVMVSLNDRAGNFTQTFETRTFIQGRFTGAFDMNGDRTIDLLLPVSEAGSTWIRGNGDGTFAPAAQVKSSTNVPRVWKAADMNGDGADEIIGTIEIPPYPFQYRHTILWNDGKGNFSTETLPLTYSGIAVFLPSDIDGDGRKDLVVSTRDVYAVYRRSENGWVTFGNPIVADPWPAAIVAGSPARLAISFKNAVGKSELIVVSFGSAAVVSRYELPEMRYPLSADFDNDGHSDILTISPDGTLQLFRANRAGSYDPMSVSSLNLTVRSTGLGDFDGDGNQDLAVDANGLNVFRGNGRGGFEPFGPVMATGQTSIAAVEDINGDGRSDILTSVFGGFAMVYLGTPKGVVYGGAYAGDVADSRFGLVRVVQGEPFSFGFGSAYKSVMSFIQLRCDERRRAAGRR